MLETVDEIRDHLVQKIGELDGVSVTGIGFGYSNGPYADLSIKLPNGEGLFILIEPLVDDEFEDEED